MMGYAARREPSAGAYDDLYANAVALSCENEVVVLLALDVASLDLDLVAHLKGAVRERTELGPDRVLTNTSHTHAGPMVASRPGLQFEAEYVEAMIAASCDAVAEALDDRAPAMLSLGAAPLDIGCNRRERTLEGETILGVNREGPRLAEVTVWRLGRADCPEIVLFSTPIHGTVLGAENLMLSSEWMGAAVRELEGANGDLCAVFLQGCAGNQNPYRDQRSYGRVLELGVRSARAVQQARQAAEPVSALPLANLARHLLLPLKGGGTAPCPIHGVRLGDALLVGLGGEAFVEYTLYAREVAPNGHALVLGYTDGSVGYLPTAAAYAEGGYEPDANQWFPMRESWHPRVERCLKSEITHMVDALY